MKFSNILFITLIILSITKKSEDNEDFYAALGIKKHATEAEIKKTYRKLSLKWHPNKNPNNRKEAEDKFKKINKAYSVLSDKDKRRQYDHGDVHFDFRGFNADDIFKDFFSGINPFSDLFEPGDDEVFKGGFKTGGDFDFVSSVTFCRSSYSFSDSKRSFTKNVDGKSNLGTGKKSSYCY